MTSPSELLEKDRSSRYPVITIVLYYGKEPWNAPRHLKDRLDVPACLDKYVSDYHINVFDISHMEEAEIDQFFTSDFRILAQFMRNTDCPGKISGTVEFPDPLLKIMTVLTGDHRFENLTGMFPEGGVSMTNVFSKMLDDANSEGIKKGLSEGISKGACEASAEIARKLFLKGISFDDVEACVSSLSKEELQKIFDEVTNDN